LDSRLGGAHSQSERGGGEIVEIEDSNPHVPVQGHSEHKCLRFIGTPMMDGTELSPSMSAKKDANMS